jgi:ornithine cyclodeaminase
MRIDTGEGTMLLMPAHLRRSNEIGFKMVSVWDDNPSRGLPCVIAWATAIDPKTGELRALMNGEALTALRTAAGGGLAAKLLSREDSAIVALFGAGVQGLAQLEAVLAVREICEVRIYDPVYEQAEQAVRELADLEGGPDAIFTTSPAEAVAGADIVITATTSKKPVFDGKDLKEGAHITGVGSWKPDMQEIDAATVCRAKVVVDSMAACMAEAGDIIIPISEGLIDEGHVHGELGQVVSNDIPGRESAEEITFFKSVGVAVQDAAAVNAVLRAAEKKGLGTMVTL